jgi:hypothetical protein
MTVHEKKTFIQPNESTQSTPDNSRTLLEQQLQHGRVINFELEKSTADPKLNITRSPNCQCSLLINYSRIILGFFLVLSGILVGLWLLNQAQTASQQQPSLPKLPLQLTHAFERMRSDHTVLRAMGVPATAYKKTKQPSDECLLRCDRENKCFLVQIFESNRTCRFYTWQMTSQKDSSFTFLMTGAEDPAVIYKKLIQK